MFENSCPFASPDKCPIYILFYTMLHEDGKAQIDIKEYDSFLEQWKNYTIWSDALERRPQRHGGGYKRACNELVKRYLNLIDEHVNYTNCFFYSDLKQFYKKRDKIGIDVSTIKKEKPLEKKERKFSDDFTWICFNGQEFHLTGRQAEVVKYIYEQHNDGIAEVRFDSVAERLNFTAKRLRDVFRSRPEAYKVLFSSPHKGSYKLLLR